MAAKLRIDGPWDDEAITEVSETFAESVSLLNHGCRWIAEPSTLYRVLGDVSTGLHRLEQTLRQADVWLAGRLESSPLGDDHGDVVSAVDRARRRLVAGAKAVEDVALTVDDAQQATSGLHTPDQCELDTPLRDDRPAVPRTDTTEPPERQPGPAGLRRRGRGRS